MDAITAAFLSASERMPGVTLEAFTNAIEGFDVHPITLRGEMVGALLVSGPEIHACVLPHAKGHWLNKKILSILNDVVDRHGYAQTRVTTPEGAQFVKSLGFEKDGDIYRSTKKWALNRY